MNVATFTLPNGLKVILESLKGAQSVAIYASVGAGSRYESKETAGLAHFLEHMLLEGTKNLHDAKAVAEYVENVGGKYGAFTEKDHVVYYVKMLPEQVEKGINFIHEILFNSLIYSHNIEKEKNIVFEEMKRAEDNPEVEIWDVFNEWVWGENQSLGRSTLGSQETIKKITKKKLLKYLKRLYMPSNIVISIVGKIEQSKIKKIVKNIFIEKYISKIPSRETIRILKKEEQVKVDFYKSQQAQMILGFPNTVTYGHQDRYPLLVIATLLGGASSARLFHKIVYELGIAYFMSAYSWVEHDVGLFSIYGGFTEKNIEQAVNIMFEELMKLKSIKLSKKELTEANEKTKANIFFYTETTDSLARMYAYQQITENRITTLDKIAQKIDEVNAEDIFRASNTYFTNETVRLLIRGSVNKDLKTELEKLLSNFT